MALHTDNLPQQAYDSLDDKAVCYYNVEEWISGACI
jgi:hypothetical protein